MDQPKLLVTLNSFATIETEEINKPDNYHREKLAQLGTDTCSSEDERRVRLYQGYQREIAPRRRAQGITVKSKRKG